MKVTEAAMSRDAALHTLRQVCDNLVSRAEHTQDPNEILQLVESWLACRPEPYFIDNDDNGHWYVLPAARREEWDSWLDKITNSPAAPVLPAWATYINGPANLIEFYWDGVVRR